MTETRLPRWLRRLLHAGCAALALGAPACASHTSDCTSSAALTLGLSAPVADSPPGTVPAVPTAAAPPAAAPAEGSPPAWEAELSVDALVEQVLARNPSLAQMVAAWQAAQARYPQVTALEDPMLMGKIAPAAIGTSGQVHDHFYMVEASQKLPWCGKLALRGENAQAEARAAGHDIADMRLQLVESARDAFYEYYLAGRALEVNERTLDFLERYRKNAATRYERGLVPLQDVEQARVEIGREQDRRLTLEETRRIAVARINTLAHLPPDSPLPPPPRRLSPGDGLPDVRDLRAAAVAGRPDLLALADHIRAEEAALGLAEKEFYPDFEVAAGYDAFWDVRSQRPEVNVRLNLPIYRDKRNAAVAEAQAKIAQRRAELAKQTDQVNFEVQQAYERVRTSEQVVHLYEKTVLPAARQNVEAAESGYETGKIPFLSLVEAQRNEVMLLDRYHEAVADYFRRRATLERVVGGPPAPAGDRPVPR
jgi:outer membrane protein TolC